MTVQRKRNHFRLKRWKKNLWKKWDLKDFPLMKYLLLVRPFHIWVLISQNNPNKIGVSMHSLQRRKLGFRWFKQFVLSNSARKKQRGLEPTTCTCKVKKNTLLLVCFLYSQCSVTTLPYFLYQMCSSSSYQAILGHQLGALHFLPNSDTLYVEIPSEPTG